MTDESFDKFLAEALRPAERDEDRLFAHKVIKRIGVEQQLGKQRSALVRRFAFELAALTSVAAAMAVISKSPALLEIGAEQLPALLAVTLAGFGAWIWISSSALLRIAAERSI